MCNPDNVTSLVKQHIPDAKLTAQSEEKLVYTLPLERTNKFPGNRMWRPQMTYNDVTVNISSFAFIIISPNSYP